MKRNVIRLVLSALLIGTLAGNACFLANSASFSHLGDVAAL